MSRSILLAIALFFSCLIISCSNDDDIVDDDMIVNPTASPNILFIIADDLGLDAMSGYSIGDSKPLMPTIQKLMDEGIRFNNFWANPTCTPTRSSIITGKYGFRTGVTQVGDVLSTTEIALQQHLRENNSGYSDAVIGKWHLSTDANHAEQMGVDYYAGLLSGGAASYENWNFTENGQTNNSTEYITSKFSDLAIDWIGEQSTPWFLWLAYTAPHTPFHLPPLDLHSQDGLPADQASIDANPLPYYLAAIEAMDTEIGRVISSLSTEELENTMIIFIGDNGTPGQVAQEFNNNRVKGTVYRGGINVPMVISGKGVTRINQSEDALINSTDLFSTISEIAGLEGKEINDSKSFYGLLTNANETVRDYIYAESGKDTGGSDYTIRNQTHKYIKFDNGNEALYNLSSNPFENPNLLNENQLPLSPQNELILDELVLKLEEIRQ